MNKYYLIIATFCTVAGSFLQASQKSLAETSLPATQMWSGYFITNIRKETSEHFECYTANITTDNSSQAPITDHSRIDAYRWLTGQYKGISVSRDVPIQVGSTGPITFLHEDLENEWFYVLKSFYEKSHKVTADKKE